MNKIKIVILLMIFTIGVFASNNIVYAEEYSDDEIIENVDDKEEDEADDTEDYLAKLEEAKGIEYGVLIINGYTTYKNDDGTSVTTNGDYAPDAAFLGVSDDGSYIFKQSGATGYISATDAYVVDYDTFVAEGKIVSVYNTNEGVLYHKITTNNTSYSSSIMVGYQQDYMEDNTTYYSYDGIYFYLDYKTMIDDYKNDTYKNSINESEPYYNYYLYLSYRTTCNYTVEQIEEYLTYKLGEDSTSVLIGNVQDFFDAEETYGANALLMLAVAINESNWGRSTYATTNNNLFGHGAYDNNEYSVFSYENVSDCIEYHADTFVSQGYADPLNWRYYGSNLGNKESGSNVKYASDPYWGEKAASYLYSIEQYFSDDVYDYNSYQIGIASAKVIAYNEPGGTEVYNTLSGSGTVVDNLPVVVVSEVMYNDELWYKIQSDGVLIVDGTDIDGTTGVYDFDTNYVYMKASEITLVNSSDIEYEELTYTLGDPSGDNSISAIDYMLIKNHIMGTSTLTGTALLAADVNKDDKISAIDYMMIKNHIMGTSLIE